ncbi:MAG: hypothetical protein K2P95_04235 [Hyphomonadaceae bacterium]|nr:hypothetical protein [Hyphomonadaceae bacterium]
MGRMLRFVGWGALAAFVLTIGVVGWNLCAKPFSLRLLVDRQAVVYLARNPQLLTALPLTVLEEEIGRWIAAQDRISADRRRS